MASARQQALYDRRASNKIHILAPAQTGISSIAKQNASNETDIMIAKYNSGQIGNEEMKLFLQKQLVSPYTSQSDKTQIQTKLLDFDILIEKDRLEAVFKSAPENSLQKEQAAQALAQFYTNRASTMVAGTPAHSQALENAGVWKQTIASIQSSVSRQQRKNLENSLLQKVNSLPTSSSERSQAQAEMYKQLYDMANSQGDTEDAQAYAAKYNQALTMAQQYQQTEAEQTSRANRKDVINTFNQAKNDYHDGKIDANTYYSILTQINDYAVQNNDATLQNSVNSETDRVAKIEAKGGLNRGTIGGLPVVLGKGGAGAGTTDWDQTDYKISNGMVLAQRFLKDGQTPDGKAYTPEDYSRDIGNLVDAKATLIDQRINDIEAIASENPNVKVVFNGKRTRAADVLQTLYKEQDEIKPQSDAVNAGTFAIMEVAPNQFTKAGAYKISGKSTPEYQVIDINSIPPELKDLLVQDDQGIYHQAYRKKIEISADQYDSFNPSMSYDKNTGKYYKLSDQLSVDLYQPEKSKIGQSVDVQPGQPIKSLETIQREAEQAAETIAKVQEAKKNTIDATMVAPLPPKPPLQKIREAVPVLKAGVNQAVNAIPDQATQAPFETLATALPKSIQPIAQNIIKTVQQSPIQALSNATINKPSQMPVSNSYNAPILKTVNNVPSVKQYDVNKGFVYQPIKTPTPAPAPPKVQAPSIGTVLAGAAGQAFNKVKSLFKR